jgi:hypothetical protein
MIRHHRIERDGVVGRLERILQFLPRRAEPEEGTGEDEDPADGEEFARNDPQDRAAQDEEQAEGAGMRAYDRASAMPPPYYMDHFAQVLAAVTARYGFLLTESETAHITRIEALSSASQMLYARLVNRRGPYFRADKLAYPEIPSLDEAQAELRADGFMRLCDPAQENESALACFTMTELRRRLPRGAVPRGGRRADLLAGLAGWDRRAPWLTELLQDHPVISLAAADPWPFLRFLFFGDLRDNLSDFVVRELGYVVPETIAPEQLTPLFATRAAAVDAYRMARLYEDFRAMRDRQPAAETLAWWQDQSVRRDALSAGQPIFDRLIDRLGRRLEREGMAAAACVLYRTSPHAPARERLARLLLKQGERAEAVRLLQDMAATPTTPQEGYAAAELLRRTTSGSGRSAARRLQKDSRVTLIDAASGSVEQATLLHYAGLGWQGIHSENWLWNAAFGLLLWDIIYDPASGAFHSPLQIAPADLYDRTFYARRRQAIEDRLVTLSKREQSRRIAAARLQDKAGIANPFLAWTEDLPAVLDIFLDRIDPSGLTAVLRRMAQDLRHHTRGFPDLFLWRDAEHLFVEVKSENDQLSAEQYQWLTFFAEAGIPVQLDNVRRHGRGGQTKDENTSA